MTPAELAALRARFPELAGMGAPAAADYLARRFPVGQTPEQFAPTGGATFTPQQQGAIDAAKARRSAGEWQGADAAQGPWTKYASQATASGKAVEVQLPDGTLVEFPAGTDEATMQRAIMQHLAGTTTPAWESAPKVTPPSAEGSKIGENRPRPVAEIRSMVLKALGKAEGSTAPDQRSQDMAARIAAAKAGTLTVSPENAARAAGADAAALTNMQGGNADSRDASGFTVADYTAASERARAAGDNVGAARLATLASEAANSGQGGGMADALRSDIQGPDGMTVAQLMAKAEEQDRQGFTGAANATRERAFTLSRSAAGNRTPGIVGGTSGAIADGILFGFGDEYMAGLSAVLGVQPDGQGGANWFDYTKPIGERYDTALDALRIEQEAFRQAEPVAAIGGEVLGSLLGPVKGGGAFINAGTGTAARVGRGALVGAAGAGAYGFGEGEGGIANRAVSGALAAPVGLVAGGALTGAGQAFNALRNAVSRNPALREAMPTLEGLREAASGLYAKAREMGGELSEGQVSAMTKGISARINEAGFDRQLHPRVAAVVDRLTSETGPKSLQEMEILRRVAGNAAASLQPDERRIASQIIDAIDDAVDDMGGGSAALGAARETWSRLRRMETIDEAITKAGLTDDFAAGLRNQFKILLRNPRRLRGFSEAQKAAIRAVAMGGPVSNGLRHLGKLLSPTGISGAALTGGAAFSGAGLGSLAIPAAGAGMTAIANALTKSRANRALGIAGMDDATRRVIEALVNRPNIAAKAPGVSGLLGYQATAQ
ncbi:MAG: hypothetical protein Q27BPR15_12955 [Rhodobacter sp. CACIA14H1]|nr:MAG: hypothetical protein Q27BPR15_12955 [Rhodobacter sp. CACIA14H1]